MFPLFFLSPFSLLLLSSLFFSLLLSFLKKTKNKKTGLPGRGGIDLGAYSIQRGRDHGVSSYNHLRSIFNLSPATSFSDVFIVIFFFFLFFLFFVFCFLFFVFCFLFLFFCLFCFFVFYFLLLFLFLFVYSFVFFFFEFLIWFVSWVFVVFLNNKPKKKWKKKS